jgi:hypothetical protein
VFPATQRAGESVRLTVCGAANGLWRSRRERAAMADLCHMLLNPNEFVDVN